MKNMSHLLLVSLLVLGLGALSACTQAGDTGESRVMEQSQPLESREGILRESDRNFMNQPTLEEAGGQWEGSAGGSPAGLGTSQNQDVQDQSLSPRNMEQDQNTDQ